MKRILLLLLMASPCWAQLLDYTRARHVTQYVSPMVYTSSPSSPVDNSPPSPALLTGSGVDFDSTRAQISGYAADCDTTRLLVKLNGYSTNRSDGTLIIAQSSGFLTDTTIYIAGLTQDTIAYWSLYQADSLNNWTVTRDTALIKTAYTPPDLTPPDSAANFLVTSDVKETIRIRSSDFPTDVDSIFGVTSPNTITTLAGLDTLFALIASDTSKLADSTFAYPVISDSTVNLVMQLQDAAGNEQNSTQWNKQSEIQVDSIGPSGGGTNWDNITFFTSFENGIIDVNNGDYSAGGDTAYSVVSAMEISESQARVADSALSAPTGADYAEWQFGGSSAIVDPDSGAIAFWFTSSSQVDDYAVINWYQQGTTTGPSMRIAVYMESDEMYFLWNHLTTVNSTVTTTTANMTADSSYFITVRWNDTDNFRCIVVRDSLLNVKDSTAATGDFDQMALGHGQIAVGAVTSSSSRGVHIDQFMISSSSSRSLKELAEISSYNGSGGGGPAPDTTPPDSAASFAVFSPARDSITYDVDGYATDAVNVIANYKAGSYPTSRTDGTVQFNYSVADSNAYKDTTFFFDAPTDNTIRYWRVWFSDNVPNWSSAALTNQDTVSVDSTGGPPVTPGPEGSSMFIITGLSGATKGITVNGNSIATQAVEQTTLYFKSDSTGGFVVQ